MSEAFYEAMKEGKILQMPKTYQYHKQHVEDFKKSGLIGDNVRKAGYVSKEYGWEVPITNPLTKEIYYYRTRLDKPLVPKNKKDKNDKSKELKYLSPPGSEPHVYFSLQVDNWSETLSTPTVPLLLTEGEKKADKAIQEGFSCVAVSGVWCWSENHEPIDDLKRICAKNRLIPILFDSDYKDKPQVQKAIEKLTETVKSFGAIPVDCSLPGPEKGLDDFLVARGKEALKKHIENCIKVLIPSLNEEKYLLTEAIKYLSSNVIRDNFLPRLKKVGLVGEERNAVICYVAACSRLSYEINGALHVTLLGPSSGGKSSIAEKVCEHFIGEGNFKERASFTVAALYRGGKDSIKYQTLLISEVVHLDQEQEDISALFRTFKTRGNAKRELTVKLGNDFVPVTLEIEGPSNFIGTTTSFAGKDEDLNRDVIGTLDDSPDQTKKIRSKKNERLKKYNSTSDKWISENKTIQLQVQDILLKLIPIFIEIPYVDKINYPDREERARRDGEKIDKALQAICHINMLNRKLKLVGAKEVVNEIKDFIKNYNFRTSELDPVVSIQNLKLDANSKENQLIEDQNNNTTETIGTDKNKNGNYEVLIAIDSENIIIDSPDPFLSYGILEEFVLRRNYDFILISDERDFSVLQEYFGPSIESSYNELGHALMKHYRSLIQEGERSTNYEFTAARFAKVVNQSDTWTRKVLNQLAEKDFAELLNPGKKPLKFKVLQNKLVDSHDSMNNSEYKLFLRDNSGFSEPCCFDYEYCRITRQFFIKPKNEIKTTDEKSEVPIEEPSTFKNNSASSGGGTATEQQLDIDPVLADIEKRRQRWK